MHLFGRGGVRKHLPRALQLLTDAAENGIPDAHFYLAEMYVGGIGVGVDFEKALKHYLEAAKYNHIGAKFKAGEIISNGKGETLNKAPSCEHALGLMKSVAEDGVGYSWPGQHMEDARKSLILTASSKHFRKWSAGNVGLGEERALLVYLQAAEMGVEQAQSNAAELLQFGIGVPYDFSGAARYSLIEHYLYLSSQQGNIGSNVRLGDVQLAYNPKAAIANYRFASDRGNAEGSFNLGVIHQRGKVVKRDMHLAKRYYDLAIRQSAKSWLPVKLAKGILTLEHFFSFNVQSPQGIHYVKVGAAFLALKWVFRWRR